MKEGDRPIGQPVPPEAGKKVIEEQGVRDKRAWVERFLPGSGITKEDKRRILNEGRRGKPSPHRGKRGPPRK